MNEKLFLGVMLQTTALISIWGTTNVMYKFKSISQDYKDGLFIVSTLISTLVLGSMSVKFSTY